jgi:hypothetical protein
MTLDGIEAIRARRRALLDRIAGERAELGRTVQELSVPIAVADRVVAGVRYVRARPLLGTVLAGIAGFASARLGRRLRRTGLTRLWWLPAMTSLALDVVRAASTRTRSTTDRM